MGRVRNKIRQIIAQNFFQKEIYISSCHKFVSFTFDDVPKSGFQMAGQELDKHGAKGTFYLALSMMEGVSDQGTVFDLEDLRSCHLKGHELGCHTFNHIHFHQIRNPAFIKKDLKKNQDMLKEHGIDKELLSFSFPFGEQSISARKIVSGRYCTARGINPGINLGKTDIFNLKSVKLYEQENQLERIFGYIDELDRNGGWLIFYTHDIQPDYSIFGCSKKYFNAVLQKCMDLNLEIKPIREVASYII